VGTIGPIDFPARTDHRLDSKPRSFCELVAVRIVAWPTSLPWPAASRRF
jgi:hypothetical protein